MYKIIMTTILWISIGWVYAQDFSFGKVSKSDFDAALTMSESEAVVLREFGKARIEYSIVKKTLVLNYYYHTRILIRTKDGLEHGNFSVPLYISGSEREFISNIKGITYAVENGKVAETTLEKKNILTEKISENLYATKIALPNVREGSIIELRYTTESPFLYNLQSWTFENFIPKVYSEFVTEIPEICTYHTNLRSFKSLSKRHSEPYDTQISTELTEIRGTRTTYAMENIPAFVKEDYMTAPSNYMSKMTFELARYSIPFGPSKNFTKTWQDVEQQLAEADDFGKELNRKNLFKEILPQILTSEMDERQKAKTIYEYIKAQIKWNKKYGMFADNGVKKALTERNGNIADINLALINALDAADIKVSPVILSTRDKGFPSFVHPAISDFNYVIAHVTIGDTEYLLDASDINHPFGLIPLRCINFKGRLLSPQKSDWIDLKANASSSVKYVFNGILTEEGTLEGKFEIQRYGYAALHKRNEIKDFNSLEEYFENQQEKTNNFHIIKSEVNHLDLPDNLLVESHNIEIKNFAKVHGTSMSFNPLFTGITTKNPFNLDERNYPVDLGSKIEEAFEINILLPDSYKISQKPNNINLALPNRDARYLYTINESENTLSVQVLSSLNKPLFLPEEYLNLKEFFSRIIQSQKIDLTIEKS